MPNKQNISPEIRKLITLVARKIAVRLHLDAQACTDKSDDASDQNDP